MEEGTNLNLGVIRVICIMKENKKQIWVYHSMKKGMCDNDYYFYEDGTILHHYDRTIQKLDIEEYVLPSDIPDYEKEKIITKCKEECSNDIVEQIERILTTNSRGNE